MLRKNFFYNFFRDKKTDSKKIIKYNSKQNIDIEDNLKRQLLEIDTKISENSKALIESQIVKLRSTFSNPNNLIEQLGKNVYKAKLEDSIKWHQKILKELYLERKYLQIQLEKNTGVFWINRLKRFLTLISIGFFIILLIFIFISGFMFLIYLLPFILIFFFIYILISKK